MRKLRFVVVCLTILALAVPVVVLAAGGTITQLDISGGGTPNSTIKINAAVQADSKIQSSNITYTITAPDYSIPPGGTHSTLPPRMDLGATFSDNWTTSNNGWPSAGTYTIKMCWSTGNATNCDIASQTTTFYSVPALGWGFGILGIVILLYWLWRRRAEFEPARAGNVP